MTRRENPNPARAGFTLLELLVVMSIIATLASLILSAVFTVRESQMKSFTETLVQKLGSAMDQQVKATMDQAREEWAGLPAATLTQFMTLGNNDPRLAKVIYVKARLAQEFPATFTQAIMPLAGIMNPKPAYIGFPASSPATQPFESSILMAMSLSQSRRGMSAFTLEQIEPTAIRTATINGKTYPYFVDSWGTPLRQYVFPYYNDELNQLPYFDPNTNLDPTKGAVNNHATSSPDPMDLEQALASYQNGTFAAFIHPLIPNTAQSWLQPGTTVLRNMIPVVLSAGRDQDFGDELYTTGPSAGLPTQAALQWMKLTGVGANDNICSYRLRQYGRRGD